ncbi:hypothetical protein SeLEV6574_g04192 [Synchytrium endobioticum]|uniref:Uncharacterized protein n=1 Tax=Synchytrium endobioticum TaxID=286115 RepID=A0A507D0E7_9FUNG|nr:hypothetical protein SeLEV6574_g04192 [Synchytrium endobioticum]
MGIKYFWKYLMSLSVVKEKLGSVDSKQFLEVTGTKSLARGKSLTLYIKLVPSVIHQEYKSSTMSRGPHKHDLSKYSMPKSTSNGTPSMPIIKHLEICKRHAMSRSVSSDER